MKDESWVAGPRAAQAALTPALSRKEREHALISDPSSLISHPLSFYMAKCEEGYLCDVCGGDVETISESDLYLRYVIGLIDPETLHTTRERHIRCNPTLAQFIVAADFEVVLVDGPFDKRQLDAEYVHQQEELVTRGWKRLHELERRREPTILDYPLPEVRAKLATQANNGGK